MNEVQPMQERIPLLCKHLEQEKNIKILFAIENGSRAWRMHSKDSDYDVRFVFVRPIEDYIQIHKPTEVIEVFFDERGNPCEPAGAFIDMVGFDIFKFVAMLSSSNPTAIEWLVSDIVYFGTQTSVFQTFATTHFNPVALYHHYKSMCRQNYLKYLKTGAAVTYKKYLYAYRGLINAKWVVHKKSIPPIIFVNALGGMQDIIPESVFKKLHWIIERKAEGREKDIIENLIEMDSYIEQFLKDTTETPTEKGYATLHELNEELRRIVLGSRE